MNASVPLDQVDQRSNKYKYHGTPLSTAVQNNQKAAFFTLLEAGADPNVTDKFDDTPLDIALYYFYPELAAELIKRGGLVTSRPFEDTAEENESKKAKKLVQAMLANQKLYGHNGPASARSLIEIFEKHFGRDVAVFDHKAIPLTDIMLIPDCSRKRVAIVLKTGVENHGIKQVLNSFTDSGDCREEVDRLNTLLASAESGKIGVKITNNYGQNDPFDLYAVNGESVVSEAVVQNLSNPSDTVVPH